MTPEEAITKIRRGVLSIEEADEIEALLLSKIEKRAEPTGLTPKEMAIIDSFHSFFCHDENCNYIRESVLENTWTLSSHSAWASTVKGYANGFDLTIEQLGEMLTEARQVVDYSKILSSTRRRIVTCLIIELLRADLYPTTMVPAFPEVF